MVNFKANIHIINYVLIILVTSIITALVFSGVLYDQVYADQKPFSMILPDHWIAKPGIQHAYANSEVEGNYILVNDVASPKKFSSRDEFHKYIKLDQYLNSGFGLGNSMTTMSTDYGFKSVIELKLKKSDGNTMTMRKDFHYVSSEQKLFEVHGYSSDLSTQSDLKKTLNTFRPL
jgi:hypothetical protein